MRFKKCDPRILFILKFREGKGGKERKENYSYGQYLGSGLYWSARMVFDMLTQEGIQSKLVQVVDNNDIDREVSKFRPDVVIIEALWVVPEKFDVLKKLHPNVRWVIRLHSNIPFLANEGIAIEWLKGYAQRGIQISANETRAVFDLQEILDDSNLYNGILYLPNYYKVGNKIHCSSQDNILQVACYGAIRPLKNQLLQAVAAIKFADSVNKRLFFHINGTRSEMGGNLVLENLRSLFANTKHFLSEDKWMSHDRFLRKLSHMDLGMQVSLSETFSIVAADMVSVGLPIVVSPEITWASFMSKAAPTNSQSIIRGLERAYRLSAINVASNRHCLKNYSLESKKVWLNFLYELKENYNEAD